jgi:tetratricopeptide (TPR) repeat protein
MAQRERAGKAVAAGAGDAGKRRMDRTTSAADRIPRLRAALAALQAGRFADSARMSAPLAAADGDAEALLLHGLARAAGGDQGAAPMLARVARLRPDHAHPLTDLLSVLGAAGREAEAEPHFRAALALAPEDVRLRLAFSTFLQEENRPEEAAAELASLLLQRPGLAAAHNLLGTVLVSLGRMDQAIAAFRAAVAAEPGLASACSNLGKALAAEGDFDAALEALGTAARLRPDDAQIGLNRAIALLKSGRLAEGWREFEVRLSMPGHSTLPASRRLPAPLPPDLARKRVLLTHEEGFGDTLQFLRYATLLAERGADVLVQVPPELRRLACNVPGVAAVIGLGPAPGYDWHSPLMSLPLAFGTTVEKIPVPIPYLRPDPDEAAGWSRRLAELPGRKIGLVWAGAGRPGNPGAGLTDRLRSLPLAALAPLGAIPGFSFISLQKGPPAGEAATAPFPLFDPMAGIKDFADTAAVVAALDLVVTVDTAVAHLAGGLGRPVWLLDRHDNCWRWFSERTDSPWYPAMRIFRQARVGDWADVIGRVRAALSAGVPPIAPLTRL